MSSAMDALVGLRRRVAAHDAAASPPQAAPPGSPSAATSNSIVQRVRRRNEMLDEQIRRNSFGTGAIMPNAVPSVPVVAPQAASGGDNSARLMYIPRPGPIPQPPPNAPPAVDSPVSETSVSSTATTPAIQHSSTQNGVAPNPPSLPSTRPSSMNIVAQVQPTPSQPTKTQHSGGPRQVDEKRLAEWRKRPINTSPYDPRSSFPRPALLPAAVDNVKGRKTLVLDIDETLVHASFTPSKPFNVRLLVEVEGERGFIYVAFRPHLHRFLNEVAQLFEIVVFTASQRCYADQLMDAIDPQNRLGRLRLFREHCTEIPNARVKDLSFLGRQLDQVAIIDNSPVAYLFQTRNAIPIESWFDDPHDSAFLRLMPMLRDLARADTVYDVLDPFNASL